MNKHRFNEVDLAEAIFPLLIFAQMGFHHLNCWIYPFQLNLECFSCIIQLPLALGGGINLIARFSRL